MPPCALADDAPAWAREALERGDPVVVRRAIAPAGQAAVGVRGAERAQRYAALMPLSSLHRVVRPEQLVGLSTSVDFPALQALADVRVLLDGLGRAWGVAGSAGFQLATGRITLHANSDLDLILRTPEPFGRQRARKLVQQLEHCPCRIDVQLQTPLGGVALLEWAGEARHVLLKTDVGPLLVSDPWSSAVEAAA